MVVMTLTAITTLGSCTTSLLTSMNFDDNLCGDTVLYLYSAPHLPDAFLVRIPSSVVLYIASLGLDCKTRHRPSPFARHIPAPHHPLAYPLQCGRSQASLAKRARKSSDGVDDGVI
ncbi:hypothetical protein BD414DRAFT_319227 [Trametes punicea]|nr:hypothetical protein BD414DRAFT_319227 [Trametes punicea]